MKVDSYYCRFMVVDAEILPVMYPPVPGSQEGTWKPQLLAVHICENPHRDRRDRAQAKAQGFAGPLCAVCLTGECPLFEAAEAVKK